MVTPREHLRHSIRQIKFTDERNGGHIVLLMLTPLKNFQHKYINTCIAAK